MAYSVISENERAMRKLKLYSRRASDIGYFSEDQRKTLHYYFTRGLHRHLTDQELGELMYLFFSHLGVGTTATEKDFIVRMIKQSFSYGEPLKLFRALMGENYKVCYDKRHEVVCSDGSEDYGVYDFTGHTLRLRHQETGRWFGEELEGSGSDQRYEHIEVLSNPLRDGMLHAVEVILLYDGIPVNHLDTFYILVEKQLERQQTQAL